MTHCSLKIWATFILLIYRVRRVLELDPGTIIHSPCVN